MVDPHHCRQYFKSTVVAWGVEALKGRSPRTFIARVRRSEKVKSMGRHSPPLMSLMIRNGGLPMAGRPECMKSPPSLRSHRIRAKNGKLRVWQGSPSVLQAARLLPAHRRLPHQVFLSGLWWASIAPATATSCLLAGRLNKQAPPILL